MQDTFEVVDADLARPDHCRDVVALTHAYALDEMGNSGPLPDEVMQRLIDGLRRHPTTLLFIAYQSGKAVGLATCFLGFSTFHARSLINIHDLVVLPEHRGRGIGAQLLAAVEQRGRALGCCKLTLEVQENNQRARRAYAAAGFGQAVYSESAGGVLFYNKPL